MCQAFLCVFLRLFWGLDPTYFQRLQGGIKADWAFFGFRVIALGTASLYSGGLGGGGREGIVEHDTAVET